MTLPATLTGSALMLVEDVVVDSDALWITSYRSGSSPQRLDKFLQVSSIQLDHTIHNHGYDGKFIIEQSLNNISEFVFNYFSKACNYSGTRNGQHKKGVQSTPSLRGFHL